MADKAWQYRGEIQGRERETNAALGVDLDLERGVNINSILEETNTVEKSVSIEDIITVCCSVIVDSLESNSR